MADRPSFADGQNVRVVNKSNDLADKTGVIKFFTHGERTSGEGSTEKKMLAVVMLDDTKELRQFGFEELSKV
jgi:hypothetical protein